MKRKEVKAVIVKLKSAILFSLMCLVISVTLIVAPVFADPIKVKPDPDDLRDVDVGEVFSVDILIQNPHDNCIVAWELRLCWPCHEDLIVVGVDEGDFLSSVGATYFTYAISPIEPCIRVGAMLQDPSLGACGDGTLVTVTLKCMSDGPTSISLSSVLLDPSLTPIDHTDKNGNFNQQED